MSKFGFTQTKTTQAGDRFEIDVWSSDVDGRQLFCWSVRQPSVDRWSGQVLDKGYAESFQAAWDAAEAAFDRGCGRQSSPEEAK